MNDNKAAEIRKLVKDYGVKGFQTKVLRGIDLTILKNDFIAVMGPSGSGKTTLLNILSTIDQPTQGTVILDGKDISKMSNKELSELRRDKIGFIFQDYNLLDTMTLEDNIALPLSLSRISGRECIQRTKELEIIFADEPTGAVDFKAGRELLECLKKVHEDRQATILMVTHDPFCASYARDVYMLSDGQIQCRISRGSARKEFYDRIIDVQTSMGGDFSWES